ncbi:TPA: hypothetical protein DCF80_00060 [Candidatus Saccharibacteria bacterium]|nr:hypothetical protein [Candidatus Saccharibacteria bacterium]HRK40780.1 hypothetical protein [Candidatus Saccharibacteria bacterium]
MTLLILVVVALGLFALAFVTKRRYGVLGLGLTAGLVLSQELSKELAVILTASDFPVEPLTFQSAATIVLILAPALALLFAGPKYSDQRFAVAGSAMFAVYATLLLLAPLTTSLPITDPSIQPTINQVAQYSSIIISVGVIVAVLDLMHSHGKMPLSKKSKH